MMGWEMSYITNEKDWPTHPSHASIGDTINASTDTLVIKSSLISRYQDLSSSKKDQH